MTRPTSTPAAGEDSTRSGTAAVLLPQRARRRLDAVAAAHLTEAIGRIAVEPIEVRGEQRRQPLDEVPAARHPLVVAAAAVMIRAVQPALGKRPLQPSEEALVPDV